MRLFVVALASVLLVACRSADVISAPSVPRAKMFFEHGLVHEAQRELIEIVFGVADPPEKARALDLLAAVAVHESNFKAALDAWNRLISEYPQ